MKKDKQITFQISEKMLKDFNQKCKDNETTKSQILRDFINKYLKEK